MFPTDTKLRAVNGTDHVGGGGRGVQCARKYSWVRGSVPKIGGFGWRISLPKPGVVGDRGAGSPKPKTDIGQEEGMKSQARMRKTPRSSGSDRAQEPEMSSPVGGRGSRDKLGEVNISIVFATMAGQAEVVARKKHYPALDAWFGFSDFPNLLDAIVAGEKPNEFA